MDKVAKTSRDITLDVFAHDESASVQVNFLCPSIRISSVAPCPSSSTFCRFS